MARKEIDTIISHTIEIKELSQTAPFFMSSLEYSQQISYFAYYNSYYL